MEAKCRKPQSTHNGMNMGKLVLIHGSFAPAFSTFAKLFSECGLACASNHACLMHRLYSAQWIRHRPTEPGIAGLSPAGVIVVACNIQGIWELESCQTSALDWTALQILPSLHINGPPRHGATKLASFGQHLTWR